MSELFRDKVALVAGAGSGIGKSCALLFSKEGARVVVSDIAEDVGRETVEQINKDGGEAIFQRCDVTKSKELEVLMKATVDNFGRLDYACNNAGIGGASANTADYPEDAWNIVISVNLTAVFLCMKYEIPVMIRQGGGSIVNMASILGRVGFTGSCAYVASKHGVIGLTKTTAIEYATQGIRVNAVCPGFIYTPLLEKAGMAEGTDLYRLIADRHAMKRMGTPEEVASLVVWLCSDGASFITGESILVDGGYVAM